MPPVAATTSGGISLEVVILAITVTVMVYQTFESSRSIHASSFKAAFDILQEESVREARRIVLQELALRKDFTLWDKGDLRSAEKVIHTYDAVGVMVRSRLIPTHMIANHWGDSLRKSWSILQPLVLKMRKDRNAEELYDDFEWLCKKATEYPQRKWWFYKR